MQKPCKRMSLGEFLSEEQNKQNESKQIMEQRKVEFFSGYSQLVNQIKTWLAIEISNGQIDIEQQSQGLGNVYGNPPKTLIKTEVGTISLAPDNGPFMVAKGIIKVKSGDKIKELILKDQWYIKDEDSAFHTPGAERQMPEDYLIFNERTCIDMLKELLKS